MALVFVDVDGTLIDGASSEAAFFVHLVQSGRIGARQWRDAAVFLARWTVRHGAHTTKRNKAYLAGLDVASVAADADAFVRRHLVPKLRAHVVRRLDRHRHAGETLVLLTGTLEIIARPLAEVIGAPLVLATRCAEADGRFLAAPPLDHPFAEAKVEAAAATCRAHGTELAACAAYADAVHDLPLLYAVGRPVAVHPSAPLRRAALKQGWEVLTGDAPPASRQWSAGPAGS
jgi:HAD superfamily hydrolase (TIGR01490 family)